DVLQRHAQMRCPPSVQSGQWLGNGETPLAHLAKVGGCGDSRPDRRAPCGWQLQHNVEIRPLLASPCSRRCWSLALGSCCQIRLESMTFLCHLSALRSLAICTDPCLRSLSPAG